MMSEHTVESKQEVVIILIYNTNSRCHVFPGTVVRITKIRDVFIILVKSGKLMTTEIIGIETEYGFDIHVCVYTKYFAHIHILFVSNLICYSPHFFWNPYHQPLSLVPHKCSN